MNENDIKNIPEDEEKQRTKEMCDSCIHNGYCMAAYKKDSWCGNRITKEFVTKLYML